MTQPPDRPIPALSPESIALHTGMRESGAFSVEAAARLYGSLPPMPPAEVHRAIWDGAPGWRDYHDERDPIPEEWDEAPPDEVRGFYSGDQMTAFAEQAIAAERERCARVCERLRDKHCAAMEASSEPEDACKRDGSCGCDFVAAWNDAAEAIRK